MKATLTALLTTRDVADILRLKSAAVLRLVRKRKLKAVRLSKRALRYREKDVERFLSQLDRNGKGRH